LGAEITNREERILKTLEELYPEPKSELKFTTPFELLVATMLAAQSTDRQVNKITAGLFTKYNRPEQLARLTSEELAEEIKGCGLYRNKSQNIVSMSRNLMDRFNGQVPSTLEELITLPGVGRKTANVVLSNAFNIPALAVDTHVFRVSHRLDLARGKTPLETERELTALIPREKWSDAHHWLIFHGRRVCKARKPLCAGCPLHADCHYEGNGN